MRTFLDSRLHDRGVGVDALRRRFNVSRATVHRLFAEEGGVAAFVRRRRPERAFADLAAGPRRRGDVRRVGERRGFDDPSHFHRRFRERDGMSPAEVVQVDAAVAPAPVADK